MSVLIISSQPKVAYFPDSSNLKGLFDQYKHSEEHSEETNRAFIEAFS